MSDPVALAISLAAIGVSLGSIALSVASDRRERARLKVGERSLPTGLQRLADGTAQDIRETAKVTRPRGGKWMGD